MTGNHSERENTSSNEMCDTSGHIQKQYAHSNKLQGNPTAKGLYYPGTGKVSVDIDG